MFRFGKVTCFFCDQRVPVREALRGGKTKEVAVCAGCYDKWERDGRTCTACRTPVRGPQDVGAFFKPRPSFGHADCGGVRVTR
jgi:hypothetical protein